MRRTRAAIRAVVPLLAWVALVGLGSPTVSAAGRRQAVADQPDRSLPVAVGTTLDGPLSLERAYAFAVANSQSLRRAELAVDAARAALDERRAALRPTVDATAGVAYIANPPDGLTIPAGALGVLPGPMGSPPLLIPDQPLVVVPDPENLGLSASVELRQTLYAWGKLVAAQEAAAAGVAVELSRSDGAAADLRTRTATVFGAVVSGRAALPIVASMVEVQRERVADVEEQYAAGSVTRADLLAERAALAAVETQLVRTRQALRTAERALESLIGMEFADLLPRPVDASLSGEAGLVEIAIHNNAQIAELRAVETQAGLRVRIIDGSRPFLPDLGLSVRADVQGQRIPFVQSNWIDSWDANLRISVGAQASLYDGGANAAQRRSALAQRDQSVSAIVELVDSIPLRVRVAIEQYEVAHATRAEAAVRLESARETDRNAMVSLDNELITRGDRLGARLRLLEAELGLVSADAALERALVDLEAVVGAPVR